MLVSEDLPEGLIGEERRLEREEREDESDTLLADAVTTVGSVNEADVCARLRVTRSDVGCGKWLRSLGGVLVSFFASAC